jgi:deoxycytidylate deaminase
MVDSINARRGAANNHIRALKAKFKGDLTSEYYEYFDDIGAKPSNEKQKNFMEVAAKTAMKSPMGHKHGAIIVHKGKIIGAGYNYYVGEYSVHAEVAALSSIKGKIKHLLQDSELYVVRIGPNKFNNPLKYSRPCCNCQNAIIKNNIKKTFYSTNYEYDDIRNNICISQ